MKSLGWYLGGFSPSIHLFTVCANNTCFSLYLAVASDETDVCYRGAPSVCEISILYIKPV